jgi:hypothetical protein
MSVRQLTGGIGKGMNRKKQSIFIGIILICLTVSAILVCTRQGQDQSVGLWPEEPEGCTVIMVGKLASTDGSTITTHTADCAICDWT